VCTNMSVYEYECVCTVYMCLNTNEPSHLIKDTADIQYVIRKTAGTIYIKDNLILEYQTIWLEINYYVYVGASSKIKSLK